MEKTAYEKFLELAATLRHELRGSRDGDDGLRRRTGSDGGRRAALRRRAHAARDLVVHQLQELPPSTELTDLFMLVGFAQSASLSVAVLRGLAAHPDRERRVRAYQAAGLSIAFDRHRAARLRPLLLAGLRDEDEFVRLLAVQYLGGFERSSGRAEAARLLIAILDDALEADRVRVKAVEVLAWDRDPETRRAIARHLDDPSDDLRRVVHFMIRGDYQSARRSRRRR